MKRFFSVMLVFSLITVLCPRAVSAEDIAPNAVSAIVINADTGGIIFQKNADKRLPMASTTKIMTAILLLENADLDATVIATDDMVRVEGSSMGLLAGDKVTYRALLYGLMLPSGNDAANTVAISIGGSIENFALMMNSKAYELNLRNTNFVTPSGLDSELHYSTAEDLAKLANYAMQNKTFRKVVTSAKATLYFGNPPYKRAVYGHNKILANYQGANGIKTGYTSRAGKCLVSSATRGGKNVIAVTLCDANTLASHTALLDFGFENINTEVLKLPAHCKTAEVIAGTEKCVKLYAENITVGLTAKEREQLEYMVHLPDFLYADVTVGKTVGKVVYTLNNKTVAVQKIKTAETVLRKNYDIKPDFIGIIKEFFII